jgi:DNA-directed RNA polymerase subunit RPC12/RpoP
MTSPMKTCKECGSETKVTTLESFGGEEAPVTVTVDGMPAVVCAKNHKRFLNPGFVAQVMDFVADPAKIAPQPPAVKRGLLKKHYHCSECGAELLASPSLTSERALDASFKNATSFRIIIRVALYKCERCGREQVRSNDELIDSSYKAMAHAFRGADIHPDR